MILFELLQVAIDAKEGNSLTVTSLDWKKFYFLIPQHYSLTLFISA